MGHQDEANQVIPAEAVEAAAKVAWDRNHDMPWSAAAGGWKLPYLRDAQEALEAAAPHMLGSLLEEWAVQFAVGSVEEAEDEADAKRKLREIRECIADGMETPALEPMTIVRRYRLHETELTAWKPVNE